MITLRCETFVANVKSCVTRVRSNTSHPSCNTWPRGMNFRWCGFRWSVVCAAIRGAYGIEAMYHVPSHDAWITFPIDTWVVAGFESRPCDVHHETILIHWLYADGYRNDTSSLQTRYMTTQESHVSDGRVTCGNYGSRHTRKYIYIYVYIYIFIYIYI